SATANPESFTSLSSKKDTFAFAKNDYGFFTAARYSSDKLPEGTKFIKIVLSNSVQLSRIELSYGPGSN
ncbi:MAG: hypothetical protein ACM3RX_09465, partial [Methanococcaceae archaeon]